MDPGGNGDQGGGSSNAGAVAGGVIVCLLVLGVAAAIAVILVLLLLRRRQSGEKDLNSFDNHLYETQDQLPSSVGSINGKSIRLQPTGDTKDDHDMGDGDSHEYAAVSADDANYEDMNVSSIIAIILYHVCEVVLLLCT